jgi:hypothetical protein
MTPDLTKRAFFYAAVWLMLGTGLLLGAGAAEDGIATPGPVPSPVPDELRERLHLAPFYQQHIDLHRLPILARPRSPSTPCSKPPI